MAPSVEEQPLIGQSAAFQRLLHAANMVAATDASVLLSGEVGSGRERIAREIHRLSLRRRSTYLALNCAILDDLGAARQAADGTLFLGDVDQLRGPLQGDLLALLETGCLQGVPLDVRLVASAGLGIARRVQAGEFRQDLYYRLNVVPLEVPALHERPEDIPLLLKAFIKEFAQRHGRRAPEFSVGAKNLLKCYLWPGNIRELRNFAERLVILLPGQTIQPENLPLEIKMQPAPGTNTPFQLPEDGVDLNALEADILRQALTLAGGNRSKASRLLRISRDTFLYRLQKFALLD
jgi:DNA-binding NtrC family response regulator